MTSSIHEQLDKLQAEERRAHTLAVLGGAIVLGLAVAVFYIIYVPGNTREVSGTVVSFETHATGEDLRVGTIINVRLDNDTTVRAAIHSRMFAKPGSRVRLRATGMPLIGIERYSFIAFEEKPAETLDKVLR